MKDWGGEASMETLSGESEVQTNRSATTNVTFLAGNRPNWTAKILQPFIKVVGRFDEPVILDLGPINSRQISYFGSLSWKVYVCDFFRECREILEEEAASSAEEIKEEPTGFPFPARVLDELNLAPHSLHGILLWDILDAFPKEWAQALVDRLSEKLGKGGLMFAFFGAQKPDPQGNQSEISIFDQNQKKDDFDNFQFGRGTRFYKNSDIMTLFADFNVQHFYTMKNGFRGILIQKL